MRRIWIGALSGVAVAAFAVPAGALAQPPQPGAGETGTGYGLRVNGSATINCAVGQAGLLSDCRLVSETPTRQGFGDAALKMAKTFKMRRGPAGAPIPNGGRVTIPIKFDLPPDTPPPTALTPPRGN